MRDLGRKARERYLKSRGASRALLPQNELETIG
jgi:hypothetical protein